MIKKTFLLLFTGFSMIAFAQESSESTTPSATKENANAEQALQFKPETGDVSVDFTVNNLFKFMDFGNSQFEHSDDAQGFGGGMRLRYFISPKFAARINVVTQTSRYSGFPLPKDPLDGLDAMDAAKGSHERTVQHYSASLGAEKHFSGTNRLDTYAGCELMFGTTSVEERFTNIDSKGNYVEGYRAVSNGGFIGDELIDVSDQSKVKQAPGLSAGLRVLVGADFYVFPKLYLGVELGLACSQKWIADYSLTEVNPTTSVNKKITVSDRGKLLNLSQDINSQFRIGFRL